MRLSSYNPQDRYRRRHSERMAAFMVVVFILFLAFGLGVWFGTQNAGQQHRSIKKRYEDLLNERESLQDSITQARAEAQTAQMRYRQLQETYDDMLPEGPLRDLAALLKQQLDEGRSPERLEFLIRSARPPRNCSEPETKRFVVMSPAYDGPESQISLAEGALVIKGKGLSAINAKGQPEAWYDPSKKVTIDFIIEGQLEKSKSSVMPLRHSVVVGNREYRVTVSEGARSFAKVTYDSCDYP
ncbi:MAG: hypothetical protein H6861_05560 [Rhodospirillales bacterium]|nr:hypothetical protein [Rhodospirillales bacterium]